MRAFLIALSGAVVLCFSADLYAAGISKDDYEAQKKQIENNYDTDKQHCDTLGSNDKSVCKERAEGRKSVAKAKLEVDYKNTAKHRYDLRLARADALLSIAKARCDALSGNDKDVCVKQAKANYTAAKEEAKKGKAISEADYDVAKQKCDNYSGDAKDSCVDDAKAIYGE